MQTSTPDEIKATVRQAYGDVATRRQTGCCGGTSCCGPTKASSRELGYSDEDLSSVPEGTDLGLGCGNPQAIAALKPGERVLDLGSGAGFDVFLAARQVGPSGFSIGVDMTPEMVERARANAAKLSVGHVDFRLGDIEQLPVDDGAVDVIISNCVINLAPDKEAVFREAYRVLAPGGRLAVSDVVAIGDLPAALAADPAAYTGCVAGAAPVAELERAIAATGFTHVRVAVQPKQPRAHGQLVSRDRRRPGRGVCLDRSGQAALIGGGRTEDAGARRSIYARPTVDTTPTGTDNGLASVLREHTTGGVLRP